MPDVVVTGVGAVTPLGVGARTLHERWTAGACGVRDGEAPCADFSAADFLSIKETRRADRFTQLAIAACEEATAEAGWEGHRPPYDPQHVGCILGTGIGGISTLESNHQTLEREGRISPLAVPLMMSNAGAASLSMRYDLRGHVYGIVSACAGGAHAIGSAVRAIQCGDAVAMLAGGSEAPLTHFARSGFTALEATSSCGISRPFDARRDGFVMGEGAAVLVLEDREAALARGASILATVRGYGATSDAFHLTAPHARGEGAQAAIGAALRDADLTPADIDYVNAHGTSTPLNDHSETIALKRALGADARRIPISSTKSAIGHLLGAAGAVEAVATILALRERVAPPTLGWGERDPELDLDYVPDVARPLQVPAGRLPTGISNSFGFGGHNAVLCLEAA